MLIMISYESHTCIPMRAIVLKFFLPKVQKKAVKMQPFSKKLIALTKHPDTQYSPCTPSDTAPVLSTQWKCWLTGVVSPRNGVLTLAGWQPQKAVWPAWEAMPWVSLSFTLTTALRLRLNQTCFSQSVSGKPSFLRPDSDDSNLISLSKNREPMEKIYWKKETVCLVEGNQMRYKVFESPLFWGAIDHHLMSLHLNFNHSHHKLIEHCAFFLSGILFRSVS